MSVEQPNAACSSLHSSRNQRQQAVPSQRNQRQQATPRNQRQQAEDSSKHDFKAYVAGFPAYTRVDDFKYVFEVFGNIKVKIFKKHAIITFPDEESLKAAVAQTKKVSLYGSFLTIRDYKKNNSPFVKVDRFVLTKQKSIIIKPQRIGLTGDFNHQLEQILDAVRLTQEEISNISLLYENIETALRTVWPESVTVPFGSITTGLGIKSSDADCFVLLPSHTRGNDAAHVMRTRKLLQQYPDVFGEVFAIPNAHTPIVKFFHIPTQTSCDVSFKSPLGTRNSQLLAFLIHLDIRILPLAIFIKYWAKVHGISGTGRLSNYALTMLLVFYLQQRGILPSVHSLQGGQEDLVDGWNTAFVPYPSSLPEDRSSVEELLGGFFEFYADFAFADYVVCPFLGREIEKSAFEDHATLPEAFDRYVRNVESRASDPIKLSTPVCIQDPFQLCHNVGSSISGKLFLTLQEYFKFAVKAYQERKDDFLRITLMSQPEIPDGSNRCKITCMIQSKELDNMEEHKWKDLVRDVVLRILFEDLCYAELDFLEVDQTLQLAKEVDAYVCILSKAVWDRKRFNNLVKHVQGTFVEKQMRVTQEIVNYCRRTPNLKMQLTIDFPENSRNTSVSIEYLAGEHLDFQRFGKMFRLMMKTWFFELMKSFQPLTSDDEQSS